VNEIDTGRLARWLADTVDPAITSTSATRLSEPISGYLVDGHVAFDDDRRTIRSTTRSSPKLPWASGCRPITLVPAGPPAGTPTTPSTSSSAPSSPRTIVPTITTRQPPLERTNDLLIRMLRPFPGEAGR
jgi:hypothetical protein